MSTRTVPQAFRVAILPRVAGSRSSPRSSVYAPPPSPLEKKHGLSVMHILGQREFRDVRGRRILYQNGSHWSLRVHVDEPEEVLPLYAVENHHLKGQRGSLGYRARCCGYSRMDTSIRSQQRIVREIYTHLEALKLSNVTSTRDTRTAR